MIGGLLLAFGVRVAAGRDARQQARRGEGVIDPVAAGGSAAPRLGIPGVLAGIAVKMPPHVGPA